jgi:ABC-2 type transport system permease protein
MTSDPTVDPSAKPLRAWLFLVQFSLRRIARVRQMVGIAVTLLLISCVVVSTVTLRFGWDRTQQRSPRNNPNNAQLVAGSLAAPAIAETPVMRNFYRENQPHAVFARWVVFLVFLGFLLPLWNLSFAISALGNDRESRTLIWLLTRPLPRWSIYLAKFLAVLPWCLAFNLGGFACLCLCGGETGQVCFGLFWPAVVGGTVAFTAAFHLIGAVFNRPAVVALVYAFFFETVLSELPVPGTLKRLSVNYYTRCLMYSPAESHHIPTESASLFLPVSEATAWAVLILIAGAVSALGMWWFSTSDYRDEV